MATLKRCIMYGVLPPRARIKGLYIILRRWWLPYTCAVTSLNCNIFRILGTCMHMFKGENSQGTMNALFHAHTWD